LCTEGADGCNGSVGRCRAGRRLGTETLVEATTSTNREPLSQRNKPLPRTSRVCNTDAWGPSSRRTCASASCIVLARYVLKFMEFIGLKEPDN
jgi:hypothetical protein